MILLWYRGPHGITAFRCSLVLLLSIHWNESLGVVGTFLRNLLATFPACHSTITADMVTCAWQKLACLLTEYYSVQEAFLFHPSTLFHSLFFFLLSLFLFFLPY